MRAIWLKHSLMAYRAQFLVPDWGDEAGSGVRLSYRPASLCSLAGRYDNPTLSPQSETKNSTSTVHSIPAIFAPKLAAKVFYNVWKVRLSRHHTFKYYRLITDLDPFPEPTRTFLFCGRRIFFFFKTGFEYFIQILIRRPEIEILRSGSKGQLITDPPDPIHWYGVPPQVHTKETWFFQGLEYFLFSSDIWMTFREQQVGKETRHETQSGWLIRHCALNLSSFPRFPFPLEQTGKEAVNRCVCVVQ